MSGCPGEFKRRGSDEFETCDYCGSLKFDDLLRAAENGYSIIPTDKSHKLYVMMPNSAPTTPKVVGMANGSQPGPDWQKATPELLEANGRADDTDTKWVLVRPVGQTTQMKFYMEHMPKDQFEIFIDLYKGGVLNVAYPGYFYAWGI